MRDAPRSSSARACGAIERTGAAGGMLLFTGSVKPCGKNTGASGAGEALRRSSAKGEKGRDAFRRPSRASLSPSVSPSTYQAGARTRTGPNLSSGRTTIASWDVERDHGYGSGKSNGLDVIPLLIIIVPCFRLHVFGCIFHSIQCSYPSTLFYISEAV
jgi:hypothetical protein